jgi:Family of unknown function (DUF6065)
LITPVHPPKLTLHLLPNFDRKFLPVPANSLKSWWGDNEKTRNHAQHCQPLAMANSLGYYILSPGTFTVEWNGDVQSDAAIQILDASSHCEVDSHAAYGSFTIQLGFIPVTEAPGDFVFIKGIPNERALPYSCMEAIIEAWWSRAAFGLVFLLNQAGKFTVKSGQPIAQMFLYKAAGGFVDVEVIDGIPEGYQAWYDRRHRSGYQKDFDYLHGKRPDGSREPTHMWLWRHRRNHP